MGKSPARRQAGPPHLLGQNQLGLAAVLRGVPGDEGPGA